MAELQYCEILKTNINVTNMKDTLAYISAHIDELRGSYICVSNVHTTVMSYERKEYRTIQNSAAMALPDGAPLSGYSRITGFRDADRVTGPDLMTELFKVSPQRGYRHFFYGSTQETLDVIRAVIQNDYPGLVVAGMYAPPFRPLTPEEDRQVIERINSTKPDFVWVGLGAPKQEEWMYAHRGKLGAVAIGVGAGFDYLAGNIKRAPRIMQALYMEWLYRLIQDPRRLLKRYVSTNVKFVWFLLKERHLMKKNNKTKRDKV
ncbi:MAG: WecB/TagA/CpsF family glycosyltransferase [Lachnospiraceae bacterium]|nr:WecB/TagA/CpsF family glycosyltransferase [Lachnospiraceae bacterium]